MKTDLDRLVRETLRETAGSARLDPHGWRPATADVTRRRLRIRVPHPVGSRAVAVLVTAILIAGIAVPLILLSRLGGEDPVGPRSSGRTVQGYGMRVDVPEGWDGRTVGPDPDGLGPSSTSPTSPSRSPTRRTATGPSRPSSPAGPWFFSSR